ncbi:hypothetical protein OIE75_40680 [Streptomyces sp. NBC_01723]|nr:MULTISPECIES: hypothetical protein [unclassified Streptomyces]MDQ0408667.1 hypothetical protein [Streptomyces sp. DSM 40167]
MTTPRRRRTPAHAPGHPAAGRTPAPAPTPVPGSEDASVPGSKDA